MREITSIILFSLLSNLAFTQQLEGKYVDKTDYFYFNEGIAEFSIQSEGGFTFLLKGIGKFDIFSNYLIIHTSKFKGYQKKYYSKEQFEKIIENEVIAFKFILKENNNVSFMLLPTKIIQKIITIDMLRKLELEAKQKDFRLREFEKYITD